MLHPKSKNKKRERERGREGERERGREGERERERERERGRERLVLSLLSHLGWVFSSQLSWSRNSFKCLLGNSRSS
jgi:hypothetical protein